MSTLLRTRLIAAAAAIAVIVTGFVAIAPIGPAPGAQALSGSDFDPGNIISDAKFFDGSAMAAGTVQSFLNSQVPTCRSGYTCLKSYSETTGSRAADAMCGAYNGAANESAATIIYKVGVVCGVSQKVLLVLLQKEQSLVTDTDPSAGQFRSATGFACPDTAPCDAEYYGFYNQVYKAAWQYKRYTNPPGTSAFFTWYPVGKTSNVRYHPNADCGSSPVVIQNKATAGLYYYTPYQPNAVALSNLYGGQSDGCSSYGNRNFWRLYWDWFGNPKDVDLSPVGAVDSATANLTTATIRGWAFDPETSAPVTVHLYVGGSYESGGTWGGAFTADVSRPDVAAAYPAYGAKHGFSISLPVNKGSTTFCVYAINQGSGQNRNLGCQVATTPTGSPIGNVESATIANGTVSLQGWALDPDSTASVSVHVYVNGEWGGAYTANVTRPDVAAAYDGYGAKHGFKISGIGIPVGTSQVCVFGIDLTGHPNSQIGCRTVSTASGPPKGSIDSAVASLGSAVISGWAIDPDTPKPIAVHAYVNGDWASAATADQSRQDVARAFPGYGDKHGYSLTVPLRAGPNTVCVYGINVTDASPNAQIACQVVNGPSGPPFGSVDEVSVANGQVTVRGWVIDPDTAAATQVHVYDNDGWIGAFKADTDRGDVSRAYPGYGAKHGYQVSFPARSGDNKVCVYGINIGLGGTNPSLGCVVVAAP